MDQSQTPPKKRNPIITILVVLGAIFALCAISGLAGIGGVANQVSKNAEETKSKDQTAWENPAKLKEAVTVKDVTWTVQTAQNLGSKLKTKYPSFDKDCVANSGKFIKITFKVKNNYKEMKSLTNIDLVDDQKRSYIRSSEVSNCVSDELYILDNINPGIEKTYTAVYEVPSDAKGLKAKVGDLDLLGNEYKYIELGL
ncbi:DUF4352 domain-containing protein [bacterium]|nr:DUF4352 domain-containing protein [bacterium]